MKTYFRKRMEELQEHLHATWGRKVRIMWSWGGGEEGASDWEAWYINPITNQESERVCSISGVHALEKLIQYLGHELKDI